MTPFSRRRFLCLSAAVIGGACSSTPDGSSAPSTSGDGATPTPTTTPTTPVTTAAPTTSAPLAADPFALGVASGDPDPTSVVLWTRLIGAGLPDTVPVRWELSAEDDFATLEADGVETATADDGHSVHALATAPPGEWFYRFSAGGFTSAVGRTRVPAADAASARFVSASCQNYEHGFFHAHADIAEQRPDFMVWLGDYIYEGGGGEITPENGNVRTHGAVEPTTVAEYRARYELYKRDPNLQAAHAVCPWFVIWDDHEVENNYAATAPQDGSDSTVFATRRAGAYKVWWEHMPVRLPAPTGDPAQDYRIYRQVSWGSLLELTLLDGRQYRDDQTCGDPPLNLDPACPETFDDTRTMLGGEQEAFVAASVGALGAAWTVLAQQTVMLDLGIGEAVINYDQWDGYPAARSRLTTMFAERALANVVVLTGDIHLGGVGVIRDGEPGVGEPVATEFVCSSISSNGNVPAEQAGALAELFADLVDAEILRRGYILHAVDAAQWRAEYRTVDDVKAETSGVSTWQTFVVDAGATAVRPA
jgi:alkaline phosphatase D